MGQTEAEELEVAFAVKRSLWRVKEAVPQSKNFAELGLDPLDEDFAHQLTEVMVRAKAIHFDITLMEGLNGPNSVLNGPMDWNDHGSANWELRTIWDDPALMKKTTFYRDGNVISVDEITRLP